MLETVQHCVCAGTDLRSVGCGGSVLTLVKVARSWVEGGRGSHPSISMVQKAPSDGRFILVTHKPLINQSILIIFLKGSPGVCVCRHAHAFVLRLQETDRERVEKV